MDFTRLILLAADGSAALSPPLVSLDLVYTVAFGGLVLLVGYALRGMIRPLAATTFLRRSSAACWWRC